MIKATEAQANVINYEATIIANVQAKVDKLAEGMSNSIKFYSENGYTSMTFNPYEKSRFSNVKTLEYAKSMFQKLFEDAGYSVIENDYDKNNLAIKW